MEKDQIIEALAEWNFWTRQQDTGIPRRAYEELLAKLSATGQIIVITGARRSGKSTIIRQRIQQLNTNGVDPKDCLYVNLEEPKFMGDLTVGFLQQIYDAYLEIVNPPGKKQYIFLDEVQLIPGWEKFVRGLHEKGKAHIIVSGSSAGLLSQEFATALTGRHIDVTVYPLRFKEFLWFRNVPAQTQLNLASHSGEIKRTLREYLEVGGFPLVALQEEKKRILTAYFDDILSKDIAERHRIKKIEKLKKLAIFYLTNLSSPSSFRRVQKFIGLSLDSVERYSQYLQEAYLLFFVQKFSYSLKEQEVNPRKVYCIDNGLKNLVSFRMSENMGQLYENTVFLELLQRGKEIFYWKSKKECDFVIKEGNKVRLAIQVCSNLASRQAEEVAGLLEAMEKFKLREGLIITGEEDKKMQVSGKKVRFIPLWKWLLT